MPLVTSLLTAIVRADGDALVLHAGERPYVVAPTGQVELASRALTLDAMKGMLKELLTGDAQHSLDEFGAVQHDLSSPSFARNQKFTVIAARGGDDIWIEIRRHRARVTPAVPIVLETLVVPAAAVATAQPAVVPPAVNHEPDDGYEIEERNEPDETYKLHTDEPVPSLSSEPDDTLVIVSEPEPQIEPEPQTQPVIHAAGPTGAEVKSGPAEERVIEPQADDRGEPDAWNIDLSTESLDVAAAEVDLGVQSVEPEPQTVATAVIEQEANPAEQESYDLDSAADEMLDISLDDDVAPLLVAEEPSNEVAPPAVEVEPPAVPVQPMLVVPLPVVEPVDLDPPLVEPLIAEPDVAEPATSAQGRHKTEPVDARPTVPIAPPLPEREPEIRPAVVLPLARHARTEQPSRFSPPLDASGIDRLLRIAAARGASVLYLMSQARPAIRIDGEITSIDGEDALSEHDVEELILEVIPERSREALRSQAGTEWICDVPDVGRIRCVTFRDHRGAGGIFRMIPARAISAEQLGLSREIQGLCAEAEGLVLVAGPRTSGKSTLVAAFVNLINRTRSDHVITLETQIQFVHENRRSVVSQREVRAGSQLLSAARTALRESPDVVVIEDFDSPEIVTLALEAAQSGLLVIGALTAHTATDAVNHIIDQAAPDERSKVQLGLAENLRGIVTQVLLRKPGGGHVAAREVLLNTRAVANVIAEGKTSQLPMAIDSGRKHGMIALNDVLVAYVQSGIVDSREAYRRATDHQGFLALLKRQGIDTSFVERLA